LGVPGFWLVWLFSVGVGPKLYGGKGTGRSAPPRGRRGRQALNPRDKKDSLEPAQPEGKTGDKGLSAEKRGGEKHWAGEETRGGGRGAGRTFSKLTSKRKKAPSGEKRVKEDREKGQR